VTVEGERERERKKNAMEVHVRDYLDHARDPVPGLESRHSIRFHCRQMRSTGNTNPGLIDPSQV
jgi:hypothetical protein